MIFDTCIRNDNVSQRSQQYLDGDVIKFAKVGH